MKFVAGFLLGSLLGAVGAKLAIEEAERRRIRDEETKMWLAFDKAFASSGPPIFLRNRYCGDNE
jgi:hypothetical protein